jgi:hypothetical protein
MVEAFQGNASAALNPQALTVLAVEDRVMCWCWVSEGQNGKTELGEAAEEGFRSG